MRFLPPVAALADGDVIVRRRPLRPRAADGHAARRAAAGRRRVDDDGTRPAAVHRPRHAARSTAARCTSTPRRRRSSCPGCCWPRRASRKGIEVVHTGDSAVPSQPHLEMTVDVLRARGRRGRRARSPGSGASSPVRSARATGVVEPDLSNAAPFLAAALVDRRLGHGAAAGPRATTQAGDAAARPAARRWAPRSRCATAALTVRGRRRVARARRRPARRRRADAGARRARRAGRRPRRG